MYNRPNTIHMYMYYNYILYSTVDTSPIWTLPIVVILYKTTPELRTPPQSGQLDGVPNIDHCQYCTCTSLYYHFDCMTNMHSVLLSLPCFIRETI